MSGENQQLLPIEQRKKTWKTVAIITGIIEVILVAAYATAYTNATMALSRSLEFPRISDYSAAATAGAQIAQLLFALLVTASVIFSISLVVFIAADLLDAYRQSLKA